MTAIKLAFSMFLPSSIFSLKVEHQFQKFWDILFPDPDPHDIPPFTEPSISPQENPPNSCLLWLCFSSLGGSKETTKKGEAPRLSESIGEKICPAKRWKKNRKNLPDFALTSLEFLLMFFLF